MFVTVPMGTSVVQQHHPCPSGTDLTRDHPGRGAGGGPVLPPLLAQLGAVPRPGPAERRRWAERT